MKRFLKMFSSNRFLFLALFLVILMFFLSGKDRSVLREVITDEYLIEFAPVDQPIVDPEASIVNLSARSFLIVDVDSGAILLSQNENVSLAPASITKIMTALVSMDYYSKDQLLEVKREYLVGRNMGLQEGEKLTVFDLYLGLMVHSANDAAFVLADNYPGGVEKFIEAMNQKAIDLGFSRTHFSNFDGEEDLDHYATALDIARLSRLLLENELLSTIIEVDSAVVRDISGTIEHKLETTNQLLGVIPEIKGLKTGWTNQAGECFVSYFQFQDLEKTRGLIAVILGSNDRFSETKILLDWVKKNVSWTLVAEPLN